MPIRFRCVYCDKLLGIARRKAGAVVNCPHCGEKLIVPTPESEDATAADKVDRTEEEKAFAGTGGAQLFERSDFEALLQPEPTFRSGDDDPPPPPEPMRQKSEYPPIRLPEPVVDPLIPNRSESSPGIYLSPSRITWLSVAAVVLLALVFAGGLLVGRFFRPH
jgi:phage FluMu protein Com